MDANKEYPAFIGRITEILPDRDEHDCPTRARVVPITAPEAPTRPFWIHYIARGPICNLALEDRVWCLRAENGEGIILGRLDGSHTNHFPGGVVIEGDHTVEGDEEVEGKETVAEDSTIGGKSFLGHIHQGVHGNTSPPL